MYNLFINILIIIPDNILIEDIDISFTHLLVSLFEDIIVNDGKIDAFIYAVTFTFIGLFFNTFPLSGVISYTLSNYYIYYYTIFHIIF